MPEPNPILGVHVAPLASAWAQVLRGADGSFRVLAWGVERSPEDPTEAVAAATEITARRPFRGRGSFVALPDGSGCLLTAELSPDELDLAGDDLTRELHEYTPFEPGVAALRSRLLRTEGRQKEYQVAALPAAQERRFIEAAAPRDDGTIGLGFAGASLVRGVQALGLAGTPAFVVELLPRTTHVYAIEEHRLHRYLVAAGADEILAAAATALGRDVASVRAMVDTGTADAATQDALGAAAEAIADDAKTFARYHVAQHYAPKDPPDDLPPPRFVAAGPLLGRAPLRRALAAHLGAAFAETGPKGEPNARVAWDQAPGESMPALAGAVGAALEAFQPTESRLALRAPPREVAEVRGGARWLVPALAVVVLGVAAGGWWYANRGVGGVKGTGATPPKPPVPATRPPEAPVADAARAVALLRAADSIADVTDGGYDVGGARLEWTGEGYRVTVTASGPGVPLRVSLARLAPGVEAEQFDAQTGTADTTGYVGRWFVRRMTPPAPDALGRDAAPRLGAALDAWRAARTATARARGGTITSDASGARLLEVPGGDVAGAVALSDAADVIDAAARRSQDKGSWLDTSVVSGTPDAVESARTRRGEGAVRSAWDGTADPPPNADTTGDPSSFIDRIEAALRAPGPRTPDRWAKDLMLAPGPSDAGARVSWTAGAPRRLQRRDPGDAVWVDAAEASEDAGAQDLATADLPPGRRWRLVDASPGAFRAGGSVEVSPTVAATIAVLAQRPSEVQLRLSYDGPRGTWAETAWFALAAPVRVVVAGGRVVLDAQCRIRRAEVREDVETVRVSVPRFLPDGRVERDPGGAAVREEREERRPVRFLDVHVEDASGKVRPVSGKMTDG